MSVHCHNDLGLAVANSIAAVRAGARQVECTINGIGERSGNAALEEIVMILQDAKRPLRVDTRVVSEKIYPTSRLITSVTGAPVQPNKAIVGTNAFAHESGIHQDGLLKAKLTYEIMTPESVGIPKSSLILGKHSGRHAFRERIENLGYTLDDKELNLAFKRFKTLADMKKDVYDEDIEMIIMDEVVRVPEKYRMAYLSVVCGNMAIPTATVKIEVDGHIFQEACFGDGPVDATLKAIQKIIKTNSKFVKFYVNAITGGTDAQGEVFVKLEGKGSTVIGKGVDTDVIVASGKAYINALNKLEFVKRRKARGCSMGMTMTEKILAAHAGKERVEPGEIIEARLDLTLANDITAPLSLEEFEKAGAKAVFDPERVVLVLDHFTPNKDIHSAENCKIIRAFAAEVRDHQLLRGRRLRHRARPSARSRASSCPETS